MGNRCLNDSFAYCKGQPKAGDKLVESGIGLGNGCTKDPAKCGHYQKENERNTTT